MNNGADAEEVAQETFLKALRGLKSFRGDAKFSTWLLQIALNEARLRLRRSRTHIHESLDEVSGSEDSGYVPRDFADWREIPSEALARKELRETIEQTLQGLRPIYREVLVLRFFEELSLEEIAAVTKAPLSTVKSRLYRGLAALKPQMEQLRASHSFAEAGS